MWFIGVKVEQETSAPPPKKNPGSAPGLDKLTALSTINKPLTYSTFNSYFSISAKSWLRGEIGKLLRLVTK